MLPTRVLIVEDVPSLRLALRIALERLGFSVVEAADGREGLEEARRHLPDLVIVDLEMPVLDGWQFISALRKDFRTADLPAIAMSANHHLNAGTAQAAGFGAFLAKPFTVADLCVAITRILTEPAEVRNDTGPAGAHSPPHAA